MVAGPNHIFFIDINNKAYVAGQRAEGQTGTTFGGLFAEPKLSPDWIDPAYPTHFVLPDQALVVDIIAGMNKSFVLDNMGNCYGFGQNYLGELGCGLLKAAVYSPHPITLPDNKKITKVITCQLNTYFLDENGQWYGCGYTNGLGSYCEKNTPIPLHLPNNEKIMDLRSGWGTVFVQNKDSNWYENRENGFFPIILPNGNPIVDIVIGGIDWQDICTFFKDSKNNWYVRSERDSEKQAADKVYQELKLSCDKGCIQELKFRGLRGFYRDSGNNWFAFGRLEELGIRNSGFTPVPLLEHIKKASKALLENNENSDNKIRCP